MYLSSEEQFGVLNYTHFCSYNLGLIHTHIIARTILWQSSGWLCSFGSVILIVLGHSDIPDTGSLIV
jgi:hypothetical protein